ncbi:TBC1 domain family member 10B [Termitomyces sp. T112]|nr:TBC1 domain family member 10B [Termitomyces sp. T112]
MSPKTEGFLQVQDMDFQLIRPTFGNLHDERSSEDSGVMGRDMSVDVRQDGSFLRTDSPASRSAAYLSDTSSSILQGSKSSVRGGTDSEASTTSMTNAHNRRELKWMTVVGSVQPSQSRKSKKVKKLIFDGVPSSVRYLVWSMLTDGKARIVPGVYGQLGSREKVAALADIERDVQRCFAHQPQLQSTQGPVISLLQAYLTMVPDVQYMTGLTLIAGNLLIHAPEEDAFWIFVSLMDLHIRPYFSSTSAQVDVDATLFGRSLDNVDPMVAKKLFGELNISPLSICRPWFTSLFVGYLPPDYLDRVWDIFLFEGVPFLFRVALVLVSCSRQRISDTRSADAALNTVLYPSPELLPTSPEALITLALAAKIKDDDLQKQRVKLEAQAKRQTFAPRTVSTPHTISLPRP